ncbi:MULTISPECIES: tripartite tricarboxylate transporter substrate binding protein [unclassified Beijerinckia]|uniref:Bug family tripartite tricarboxylate transporter substrate binding protein n=1 Tax=unclassified Beijerinckia TaxID=2638183 RepID=UPI00089AF4E6|nr:MULTISPECIES: tripartite tricarboxylate transporter substrate binding protein [unclassified Beijerinckia]MDH7796891.1 tripartite-type tricarboxylate transporter receptor subunit TctC [Beijerinckia sp. GAS462]SEC64033.1 Tripartite-type tricarboxylate transporter, receptor component TctC [Beijerinckia sp. 28-YEA-48]
MISRRQFVAGGAAAAIGVASSSANSQAAWPTREIRSICPFPPGNGADVIVRFYAKLLQERIGKTIIVENRPGAFGNIATEAVARAKPDGYTIGIMAASSQLAAAAALFRKLPFDPVNDLDQITTLMKLPFVLIVAGDSPFKSVADLTAHLREQGDKGSYGSAANTGLVASELYKAAAGLKTVEVKYKDPLGMLNDLWAGNIGFTHLDPVTILAHLKSGRVRALATSAKDPFQALPNIPSAAQAGIANSDLIAWWSVAVPKGTPADIKSKLEAAFNDAVSSQEHAKFVADIGCDPFPGNHASAHELLVKDIQAWGEYVKLANIEIM